MRFSVSLRPILGDTEEEAWTRARYILLRIKKSRANGGFKLATGDSARPQAVGSRRLLEFAAQSEIHDKCL